MEAGYKYDDASASNQASDAYLFSRDIIDFGGKQCTILFGYYTLVSFLL